MIRITIPAHTQHVDTFGEVLSESECSLVVNVDFAANEAQAVDWAAEALSKLINSNNLGVLAVSYAEVRNDG